MVDLFNRIDAASRSDLDRLNETNALRFEAKLDQRTAELRAMIVGVDEKLSTRITSLDESLSARFDGLDTRVTALESSVAALDKRVSDFPAVLEKALHTQTRWMLGAWGILLASQIALWLR